MIRKVIVSQLTDTIFIVCWR